MTNPEYSAFPTVDHTESGYPTTGSEGLTIREYFAIQFAANFSNQPYSAREIAAWAVEHADALIEELNKGKESNHLSNHETTRPTVQTK